MIALPAMAVLQAFSPCIEVSGYPSENPVYLVWMDFQSAGNSVALSADGDTTEYVLFPGLLNPAKSHAVFDPGTGVLMVYSQYPSTANYYLARFTVEPRFALISGEGHDAYVEALDDMAEALDSLDYPGVLFRAWEVMYPASNTCPAEMCTVLLTAGTAMADRELEAGRSPQETVELLEDYYDAGFNLSGDLLHNCALNGYPGNSPVTRERYAAALDRLAEVLEAAGETEMIPGIRDALVDLESP